MYRRMWAVGRDGTEWSTTGPDGFKAVGLDLAEI